MKAIVHVGFAQAFRDLDIVKILRVAKAQPEVADQLHKVLTDRCEQVGQQLAAAPGQSFRLTRNVRDLLNQVEHWAGRSTATSNAASLRRAQAWMDSVTRVH